MGLIYASVGLSNPRNRTLSCEGHAPRALRLRALAPMTVRALVDTGAVNLCIPAHVALQLELEELERREVTTALGRGWENAQAFSIASP